MNTKRSSVRDPTSDHVTESRVAHDTGPGFEPHPLDRFVDRPEAARILGVKPATMADWAMKGFGPPMAKFGRRAKYNLRKLLAWAETRTVTSTATFGRGA